jgi:hypothetical protein
MLTTSLSTLLLLKALLLLSPLLLSVDPKLNTKLIGGEKNFPPIFFSKSPMVNKETPDKLREIIMDTWPQLYWLKKEKENSNGRINVNTTKNNKGVV